MLRTKVQSIIGDTSLFLNDDDDTFIYSSGLVKLNVDRKINKYFLFALLNDEYFRKQLSAKTPKGSTIRHAGDRFLDCFIPLPKDDELWVIELIENLIKNLAFSEKQAETNQKEIYNIFESVFNKINVRSANPNFSDLHYQKRLDAGLYSKDVQEFFKKISTFPLGSSTLEELGYTIRRGPNLAKRDIGRSIKQENYEPNYAMLVYPSDISEFGLVDKPVFLGTSGKIWYLSKDDILFSAEGNVGKTFAICDSNWKFTTNFHGIIITPINDKKSSIENTILITTFLNYMKRKGIIDKISVGGQGGSLAVQYWDILRFPNIDEENIKKICQLYFGGVFVNPFEFDVDRIGKLGVYEISNLRVVCKSLLETLLSDLKNSELKNQEYYLNLFH